MKSLLLNFGTLEVENRVFDYFQHFLLFMYINASVCMYNLEIESLRSYLFFYLNAHLKKKIMNRTSPWPWKAILMEIFYRYNKPVHYLTFCIFRWQYFSFFQKSNPYAEYFLLYLKTCCEKFCNWWCLPKTCQIFVRASNCVR